MNGLRVKLTDVSQTSSAPVAQNMIAMDAKSPPKLLDILRSSLWLVEYYDDPNQRGPAVIALKDCMRRAIGELQVESGKDPGVAMPQTAPSQGTSSRSIGTIQPSNLD